VRVEVYLCLCGGINDEKRSERAREEENEQIRSSNATFNEKTSLLFIDNIKLIDFSSSHSFAHSSYQNKFALFIK
jgi:hypothetical protein